MDDLLDLDWSAPSKPASAKSTPAGGASPAPGAASFGFLAQPKPLSRTGTPNYYSSTPLRAATPSQAASSSTQIGNARLGPAAAAGSGRNTPVQPPAAAAGGGAGGGGLDAFSSLLSMPSSNGANGGAMTMAQRQKAMEDEKKRKDEEDRKRFEAEGDFWDNLGTTAPAAITNGPVKPVPQSAQRSATSVSTGLDDLDTFLRPTSAAPARTISPLRPPSNDILAPAPMTTAASKSSSGTFWDGFDESGPSKRIDRPVSSGQGSYKAGSSSSQSRSPAPPADPFDFDALEAAVPTKTNGGTSTMRTPVSDFDFGDREDHDADDDDDILGDLAKPVAAQPQARHGQAEPGPSRSVIAPAARSSSPPPHIVGQIVEMGFSPTQARQALAKTVTGLDVQAALEILLGGNASTSSDSRDRRQDEFPEDDDDLVERERQRREEEERERRRRRRAGPARDSVRARTNEEREQDRAVSTEDPTEKYLAQASEIGANMFSKATSFWNSSKEKALKVYEEQRKAMEANAAAAAAKDGEGARRPVRDGRPKWMTEAAVDGFPEDKAAAAGGFKDDHEVLEPAWAQQPQQGKQRARTGQDIDQNGAGPSSRSRATTSPVKPRRPAEKASDYRSPKERADLLFADEQQPRKYVSPARHPNKSAAASRPITPAPSAPLPARQLVSATPQQLSSSAAHKAKGNEHFKLGRFAEAESSYSSAISSLPEGHLFLVPLHNNRAAARLKLGDSGPAASDCTVVIDLVGPSYHPSKEAPLPAEIAAEVKLADGLVKAISKRAQAWEMGEKWKNAVEDWEKVMGLDLSMLGSSAVSTKNLAAEGARRSRKMLEGDNEKPKAPASRKSNATPAAVRPAARSPVTAANVDTSAAVSELRKAAQAQEAEDDQRALLKDSVDARINAWKGGKETNIRGLIASLDTVLWDDMLKGGLKVGLHELVTDKQVKIKYMKVIARLHPDKINTQSTTIEQRMLANHVFGILNDAWQAFSK
ncbi:hypothetical protein IAU59_001336 [Kwoniella sp. CBS 9459]